MDEIIKIIIFIIGWLIGSAAIVYSINLFLNSPYPPPFSKEHEKLEKYGRDPNWREKEMKENKNSRLLK